MIDTQEHIIPSITEGISISTFLIFFQKFQLQIVKCNKLSLSCIAKSVWITKKMPITD